MYSVQFVNSCFIIRPNRGIATAPTARITLNQNFSEEDIFESSMKIQIWGG